MLLADRVTGIDAVPGELKTGTVWTETDITHDAWYLHQGHIPPGVMIESGQADLFLISYMGIDFKNKGDRAYRLLGCEVTYMDELARPGDTLVMISMSMDTPLTVIFTSSSFTTIAMLEIAMFFA